MEKRPLAIAAGWNLILQEINWFLKKHDNITLHNFLISCDKWLNFDSLDRTDCALQIGVSVLRISLLVLTF